MRTWRTALTLLFLLPFPAVAVHAEVVSNLERSIPLSAEPLDVAITSDGRRTYVLLRDGVVEVRDGGGTLLGTVTVGNGVTAIAASPDGSSLYGLSPSERSLEVRSVDLVHELDFTGSPFRGPPDAPVAIAVYNDFQ